MYGVIALIYLLFVDIVPHPAGFSMPRSLCSWEERPNVALPCMRIEGYKEMARPVHHHEALFSGLSLSF